MKLTVLGATGGVGGHVVTRARAEGHAVTAVVRREVELPAGVRVVVTDPTGPAALEGAVAGADAVISCVGPRSRADAATGPTTRVTAAVVEAMRRAGVRRLVMISASPVGTFRCASQPDAPSRDDGDDWLTGRVLYPVIKRVLRPVYEDLAGAEALLRSSGLDATAVRPPQLTDAPETGAYRTSDSANLPHGRKLGRADLAHALLALAPTSGPPVLRVAY